MWPNTSFSYNQFPSTKIISSAGKGDTNATEAFILGLDDSPQTNSGTAIDKLQHIQLGKKNTLELIWI